MAGSRDSDTHTAASLIELLVELQAAAEPLRGVADTMSERGIETIVVANKKAVGRALEEIATVVTAAKKGFVQARVNKGFGTESGTDCEEPILNNKDLRRKKTDRRPVKA